MSFETPGPVELILAAAISPIEEIIAEAREGRMFILVDHEDRENEGDLVIPSPFADPSAINFMATHGRGLICVTLPAERIEELGLPMMAMHNSSRHETAFTVSIEAREGVSTGISAGDRALTVATVIDPDKTAADIATPGHVFPAAGAPRGRFGARRPYRSRMRCRAPCGALPQLGDLRDHETRRRDGAPA